MPADARQWTPEQRQGIQTVDRSLLLSAAAGSGKTSVLAQRCVHLVCDADPRCAADELLVVTFTEAAAAEMKSRIAHALADRHQQNPSDHTTRQLATIDRAHVGTLHGFCSRVLRAHFHLLGLDPGFVILDGDEATLLKNEVARELFADCYDREEGGEDFRNFVDCYGDGDDQRLMGQVLKAHDTLCSVVDPTGWLHMARGRIADAIEQPLNKTALGQEYGRVIQRHLEAMRSECANAEIAVKALGHFNDYVTHLLELYQILDHWVSVFQSHGLDALVEEAVTVELPPIPRVASSVENKELAKKRVDAVRSAMKEGGWRQCLLYSTDEWKDGLGRTLPHVETFLGLVDEFTQRYNAAKEREGSLDFSDLERLTLRALRQADCAELLPSAVARGYHRQFQHVLVDEYQDINEVQDAILTLVSRECLGGKRGTHSNLFCVGDVKQSIYGFRLAEPARFLRRRQSYSDAGSHGMVIDLQQNFRSRALLLEAINGVFRKLMTREAADLDYDDSQKLKPGQPFPDTNGNPCFSGAPMELHLVLKESSAAPTADSDSDDVELDRTQREATVLAHRIMELTGKAGVPAMHVIDRTGGRAASRPARFGDIVVLLRSMRYKADSIAQVLRDAGIPVHSESATGYFEATEVNDILALLAVLDNQRQDVPLASLLRSPLSPLSDTEDNFARIRLAFPGEKSPVAFHEAVLRYAAEREDALALQLREFFKKLSVWRRQSRQRPLAELLWMIYDQTGYLAFCAGLPNGEQRQANLIELHERARQFGSFRRQGLGRFLQFLQKLKDESDLGQASIASEAEDVVRIMSIHRSKGLEFPIVFLPDLGKAINLQDCQGLILLDRLAGLGLQVIDPDKRIRYPSLASTVVRDRLRQQALAEELRVLYVAMTRAKEHVIMVGTCRETQPEAWTSQWSGYANPLPAETVLSARSMLDWIGPAAAALSGANVPAIQIQTHTLEDVSAWSTQQATNLSLTAEQMAMALLKPLHPAPAIPVSARQVIDRFSAQYPFEQMSRQPATRSATGQSHAPVIAKEAKATGLELDRTLPKPKFFTQVIDPAATDRGTITHSLLEHLDFTQPATQASLQQQVQRMIAAGRLKVIEKEWIDYAAIIWFLNSEIGQTIRKHANGIMREIPVYFAAPNQVAAPSAPQEKMDQVMIRGRLDLLLQKGKELVIVDYKTDRVTGEEIDLRAQQYAPQLQLYRQAIERITGQPVVQTVLVFLHPRQCRDVPATPSP